MARVLATPIHDGSLDFMRGRKLGIEVTDLGLRWVLTLHGDRLGVVEREGTLEVAVRKRKRAGHGRECFQRKKWLATQ